MSVLRAAELDPITGEELPTPAQTAAQNPAAPRKDMITDPVLWTGIFGPQPVKPIMDESENISMGIPEDPTARFDRGFERVPYPFIPPVDPLNPINGLQRRDNEKWDIEPRLEAVNGYDSNINNNAVGRSASTYTTAGGGVMGRLGSIEPRDSYGNGTTPYAFWGNYDITRDTFYDAPQFDALNQSLHLDMRAGRDTFVIHPYILLADVTSKPEFNVEREQRVRRQTAETGTDLSWSFNSLQYKAQVGVSANNQPDPNVDFDRVHADQQLGVALNRTSMPFIYNSYANQVTSGGAFGWQQQNGVGFDYIDNDPIVHRLYFQSRLGWEQVYYDNNPLLSNQSPHSGIRYNVETGSYFTQNWEAFLLSSRYHVYDDYTPNFGREETVIGPGVRWRPAQKVGASIYYVAVFADQDSNDQHTLLHRVVGQAIYRLGLYSFIYAQSWYEHGITDNVTNPSEVEFKELIGIEYRF